MLTDTDPVGKLRRLRRSVLTLLVATVSAIIWPSSAFAVVVLVVDALVLVMLLSEISRSLRTPTLEPLETGRFHITSQKVGKEDRMKKG